MSKKILLVDDSALMRTVLSDIVNSDSRFQVVDKAKDGVEALELLKKNSYDACILDINMPRMDGITLLKEINKNKIRVKVMMCSTDTKEGAKVTLDCLELGALDFIHKPDRASDCRGDDFTTTLTRTLAAVCDSKAPVSAKAFSIDEIKASRKMVDIVAKHADKVTGNRIVAIASSTGGPRALQAVIPKLPKNLKTPVVLVQHMPEGFTASLAERLNSLSEVTVKEAAEGDVLQAGTVYIARGGKHMHVLTSGGKHTIHYVDGPTREGVRPCANFMYESLMDSDYDSICCVVLTGMGADGTEGIKNLKSVKKVHVIGQDEASCTVYGMPKALATAGLVNQVVTLDDVAQEIIMNVGVR
ncbi:MULTISPECIES: chemotaxis response regulator protein-glutamate methylesterase [unclassified Butyrivibrio]|uniref:protein-glutamate methylesterase/protein-glutamine glutaminase n=1 Tax=unclassified Butyrivibrio TaxID=2639466 RepID=UPI0003B48C4A|nr:MULTISPECIES: chemotaxis response regulator protein-glutamate methylesterase [unclassified Butyrivibrio]SDB39275.1 two-component system, chemotaxis family, response regulator CheB [Butyrivibrio sp. INlla16]SEK43809.1 two-component system, chemotaxis family, response regulator CheB [Butyrivibrio sp. ob235]